MKKVAMISALVSCFLYAEVFELGVVEVSAKDVQKADSSVAIIDSVAMQKNEVKRVTDVAKFTPGVYHDAGVGKRNETNMIIRGFKSTQIPVYMDGIPIYVPYDGNMDLGRFLAGDLSRIMISKGSSSVLYGPNALGGAVNLVSKKPTKDFEGDLYYGFTTGKNKNTYSNLGGIRLGTKQDLFYLQLSGEIYDVDGRQASGNSMDKGKIIGSESDDYKINLKAAFTPNETDEYAFIYSKQEAEKYGRGYNGQNPDDWLKFRWHWKDWDKEGFYFLSNTEFDSWYFKTKAFYDKFYNTLIDIRKGNKNWGSIYDDYSWGLGAEIGAQIFSNNMLKFSTNYKKDVHREQDITYKPNQTLNGPWEETQDDSLSFALENTYSFSQKTHLIVGLSYDKRETDHAQNYGVTKASKGKKVLYNFPNGKNSAFNYQALLKHSFDDSDELTLSFAKKSRFPTIKDRYSERFGRTIPNPDLEEEVAYHYEVGYNKTLLDTLNLGGALFYSDVKDKIFTKKTNIKLDKGNGYKRQMQNVGEVEFYGAELSAVWFPTDDFEFGTNYTWINSKDGKDGDGKRVFMTDIPKYKLSTYFNWEFMPKLSLFASQEFQSRSLSDYDNEKGEKYYAKGFGVTNLKLTYEAIKNLNLDAGINNIFDKYYEYAEGYGEDGRTFFVNLRYNF